MLDQHPVVQIATVVTLVVTVAAGTWFIIDERERSIAVGDSVDDVSKRQEEIIKELAKQTLLLGRVSEIRLEQEAIRKELATQTLILHRIEDNQTDSMESSDNRFEMRADEHQWLATEINRVIGAMSMEIGRLKHMHEGEGHGAHDKEVSNSH